MPTQERLRQLFDYDSDNGILFSKIVRRRVKVGAVCGYLRRDGYIYHKVQNVEYLVHRLIWILVYGSIPERNEIDHINGRKHDNRLTNLRAISHAENQKNRRMQRNNTSGVQGVIKRGRKWSAQILHGGRYEFLGEYPTLAEATAARRAAEKKYVYHPNHGQMLK
jgi:hypothetical protein